MRDARGLWHDRLGRFSARGSGPGGGSSAQQGKHQVINTGIRQAAGRHGYMGGGFGKSRHQSKKTNVVTAAKAGVTVTKGRPGSKGGPQPVSQNTGIIPGRATIRAGGHISTAMGSKSPLPDKEQTKTWRDMAAARYNIRRDLLEGVWPVENLGPPEIERTLARARRDTFYQSDPPSGWPRFSATSLPVNAIKEAPGITHVIRKYTSRTKDARAGIEVARLAYQLKQYDPQALADVVAQVPRTNVKKLYQRRLKTAIEDELLNYQGA